MIRTLLAHPRTRGLDVDDPATSERRREILLSKPFLRQIYDEWYRRIVSELPPGDRPVLEIGSGAGFMKPYIKGLLTSEVFPVTGAQMVLDACHLPFAAGSLRAIVMTDVLHHVSTPRLFLSEAQRGLQDGGRIVMIEPWVTGWSRKIYGALHSEPFLPESTEWEFPPSGPLSGANGALPWIIFERDREQFRAEFPGLSIDRIDPFMPVSYLMSGGISMRALAPGWAYRAVRKLEASFPGLERSAAMFALIVITRSSRRENTR
jgi:SAM-dependent methyltransferase